MRNGEILRKVIDYARGDPKNPMTDEEIVMKFRKLCAPVMSDQQMDRALDRLWQLDAMRDMSEIPSLFVLK
jgi:2-methylcitrate dehydratase